MRITTDQEYVAAKKKTKEERAKAQNFEREGASFLKHKSIDQLSSLP